MKRLTLATVCALAFASPASACLLPRFPDAGAPGSAHFVGAATGDTLRAPAVPADSAAHRPAMGAAFGQVVSVERIGGLAAVDLPRDVRRVVLVPWSLAPDCQRAPWYASARWAPIGVRGLYFGALRDPAHWVDGVPTFDVVSPHEAPYRPETALRFFPNADAFLPPLSVDEAFGFFNVLPDPRLQKTSPREALAPMWDWARHNPALARRFPAALMVYAEGR